MDPAEKKQLLDALGGNKKFPDNSTREHLIDSNKPIQETLGDKKVADKSTTEPIISSPVEKQDGFNQQPIDQEKIASLYLTCNPFKRSGVCLFSSLCTGLDRFKRSG